LSRQECENVAGRLNGVRQKNGRGLACAHYHAAMPAEERERVQADWQADVVQVIVATIGERALFVSLFRFFPSWFVLCFCIRPSVCAGGRK
jgi:hypothetical protein